MKYTKEWSDGVGIASPTKAKEGYGLGKEGWDGFIDVKPLGLFKT